MAMVWQFARVPSTGLALEQGPPHRRRIRRLVAGEDGFSIFPSFERAQIRPRDVLQLRRFRGSGRAMGKGRLRAGPACNRGSRYAEPMLSCPAQSGHTVFQGIDSQGLKVPVGIDNPLRVERSPRAQGRIGPR